MSYGSSHYNNCILRETCRIVITLSSPFGGLMGANLKNSRLPTQARERGE